MAIFYTHCILKSLRMQINGYIPPHVHMHIYGPYVVTKKGVGAPVAHVVSSHRAL